MTSAINVKKEIFPNTLRSHHDCKDSRYFFVRKLNLERDELENEVAMALVTFTERCGHVKVRLENLVAILLRVLW